MKILHSDKIKSSSHIIKILATSILFIVVVLRNYGQQLEENVGESKSDIYNITFDSVKYLLENNGKFSTAVFLVENAFYNHNLSQTNFENIINYLANLSRQGLRLQNLNDYYFSDSINYATNFSIFNSLFDTVKIVKNKLLTILSIKPYSYSSVDPIGRKSWSNMLVTKLLATGKGNCHSLTYLYKIVADKLGAKCWLALAPNHIYIRNYSRKTGWYNTELTSGTFPTDAWIATTSYVSTDAIRSGIYMDTLSNQQSIALCVLDLAKGYEFQTHNYYDGFILKCCDLILQYHPVNPMALLLKAETLKKVYFKQTEQMNPGSTETHEDMEKAYITLTKLHYREMPEQMYQAWLNSLAKQGKKYPVKQPTSKK